MEKLKLNIQLFGGSLAITAYETDVNIANNTSYIYVELKPSTNSTTYNEGNTAYVQATLTGQNDTFTIPKTYFKIGKGKTVTAYSGKIGPFRHNADGSLNNVSISASCFIVSNTQPTATASVTMSTIPRASTISSISGNQIGSAITVNISRASSSFTHKLQVIYSNKRTEWISFGSATSKQITIPMDFCNADALKNATSGQFIFWLVTQSNGTDIGDSQYLYTMNVPSSVVPTISSVTKSDTANLANTYGGYVQGKSSLRIQTSASGAYGSSINSCVVTVKNSGGTVLRTLNGTDVTISNISYTGTLTIVSTITDSRNRTATNTSTVSVLAYSAPVVNYFTAARVSGNEGTVKLTWKASITSLNNHNGKNFYVYYRQSGTSSWTQLTSKTDGYSWQNDNYTTAKDVSKSWEFKFECWDNFTSSNHVIKNATVNSSFKLVNYKADGTGMAIGKYSEDSSTFEVGLNAKFYKLISVEKGSSTDNTGYRATRTDTGANIFFGVGSGGTNRGIYDSLLNKWLFYTDGTNTICNDLTSNQLTSFNDTSGSDWKTMLKNKLDWCISNITTTKSYLQTFINGGWQGNMFGLGMFSKINSTYQLIWFSGTGTHYVLKYGTTYTYYRSLFSSVEDSGWETIPLSGNLSASKCRIRKIGKIVHLNIASLTGWTNNSTQTGITIPSAYRPSQMEAFSVPSNGATHSRFEIYTNGQVYIAGGSGTGVGYWLSANITWFVD